jgi:uncharacterized membrane protein YtjA (UPF0391 family)
MSGFFMGPPRWSAEDSPGGSCAKGAADPYPGTGLAPALPVLKWAIIFFVISVIAGVLGFTGVASTTRTIAKVLFFIFLAIFLIVLVFGVFLGVLIFD